MEDLVKASVIQAVYGEALRSGKPVFCIVDDAIASKTKPSSRALHPIEDAYFHQSHLKRRQDYGHQAVTAMLSCNGLTLNYAVALYDKSTSKIWIVQDIAGELPAPPVRSYFLCGSWYTSKDVMAAFRERGVLNHWCSKDKPHHFPSQCKNVHPGLCFPPAYLVRWDVEVFIRQSREKLAFGQCQLCSSQGIRRYWLLMSLAHLLCCIGTGEKTTFEARHAFFQNRIREEQVTFIYQYGSHQVPLEDVLALVG